MLVNHARTRGSIDRDRFTPSDLVEEAQALASAGLRESPGGAAFALALRSFPRLHELIGAGDRPDLDDRLPKLPEAETVRLSRKGRALFDHCLEEESHYCVSGFLGHEGLKSAAGRRFAAEFIGALVEERMRRSDDAERDLIDRMIDEGLAALFALSPGDPE